MNALLTEDLMATILICMTRRLDKLTLFPQAHGT